MQNETARPLPIAARGPPTRRRIAILISVIGLNLMACCCGGAANAPKQDAVAAVVEPNPEPMPPVVKPAKDEPVKPAVEDEPVKPAVEVKQPAAIPLAKKEARKLSPMPASPSPEEFIDRFGKPDQDNSNAKSFTKPKTVRRWLVYEKANVQVAYIADDKQAVPKKWAFEQFMDRGTKAKISHADALAKLTDRDAEKKSIDDDLRAELHAIQAAAINKAYAAAEKEAARLRGVNRTNYNKINVYMTFEEVRDILGNGREVSRSANFLSVVYRSEDSPPTIISIIFNGQGVASKSIIGP